MVAGFWLRGSLQVSRMNSCRYFCHLTKHQNGSRLQSSLLSGRHGIRGCFHPGTTNIAREAFKSSSGYPQAKVTRKDMFDAMKNFIWPRGNKAIKARVLLALSLLVGAKFLNISVPFMFKEAVDKLNTVTGSHLNLSDRKLSIHIVSDPSVRFNSMNQHF